MSGDKIINININSGTFFKAILVLLLFVFIYVLRDIAAVVLFSVVVASGVEPAARWFQKYKIPRVLAVILVYLIVFSIMGIMFYLIIPPIFSELSNLSASSPSYLQKPLALKTIQQYLPELPASISGLLLSFAQSAKEYVGEISSGFFQAATAAFGGALSFALIIVLSFYLAVQEKGIENFLRIVTPVSHEKYVVDLWFRSRDKIGSWLKGQILLGVLVGVLVFLGLTILRIPYALTFALLAAIFELIPIFGPILASIPPIAVAFLRDPSTALAVIILYIIIQQFENHLIYPLVIRKTVGIPPIITILALIIGAELGGFFGVLLSVPIMAVLFEFIADLEKKKKHVHFSS